MYRRLRFILSILAVALVLRHSGAAQSQSWQIVSGLPSSVAVADILVVSNAEIYVALRTQGVRRTTDGGANWQVLNSGIEGLNAVRLGRTAAGSTAPYSAASARSRYPRTCSRRSSRSVQ